MKILNRRGVLLIALFFVAHKSNPQVAIAQKTEEPRILFFNSANKPIAEGSIQSDPKITVRVINTTGIIRFAAQTGEPVINSDNGLGRERVLFSDASHYIGSHDYHVDLTSGCISPETTVYVIAMSVSGDLVIRSLIFSLPPNNTVLNNSCTQQKKAAVEAAVFNWQKFVQDRKLGDEDCGWAYDRFNLNNLSDMEKYDPMFFDFFVKTLQKRPVAANDCALSLISQLGVAAADTRWRRNISPERLVSAGETLEDLFGSLNDIRYRTEVACSLVRIGGKFAKEGEREIFILLDSAKEGESKKLAQTEIFLWLLQDSFVLESNKDFADKLRYVIKDQRLLEFLHAYQEKHPPTRINSTGTISDPQMLTNRLEILQKFVAHDHR